MPKQKKIEWKDIPPEVQKAIARLERKRISREYWTPERLADKADELMDREKEGL
jgi:hypothetical protein